MFLFSGNIYLTDTATGCLHSYNPDTSHRFTYGRNEDEKLTNPTSVVSDKFGNILVSDRGQSNVHLLDKDGRRKGLLLTWEDGIVEPQAMVLTREGHLIVSEASTGLLKIFSYTHLPMVTGIPEAGLGKAEVSVHDVTVPTCDDGASLHSDEEEKIVKNIPKIAKATITGQNLDLEMFQRSLDQLGDGTSGKPLNQSLAYNQVSLKSGWSNKSSQQFSTVPPSAGPKGPELPPSALSRREELRQDFMSNRSSKKGLKVSLSVPDVRPKSPVSLLSQSARHVSDLTPLSPTHKTRPLLKEGSQLKHSTPKHSDETLTLALSNSTRSVDSDVN